MGYIEELLRRHRHIALALEVQPMMLDETWGALRAERIIGASEQEMASEQARLAAERLYGEVAQAQENPSQTAAVITRTLQERVLSHTQAIPEQIGGISQQVQTMQERLMETVREASVMQTASAGLSQVSMDDISRYFERDARRYGG